MKKIMGISDFMICFFAIGIAVLTFYSNARARQEEMAHAELTRKMDSTLEKISVVQDKLVNLQTQMDEFLHVNAEFEKNYKADRRKEAKALFISSSYAIIHQLDRLSIHGYYRMREYRFMAREHFNWAHFETIKLKSNIYVTGNKELHDLVNELEAMFSLCGSRINYYENEDNGLGGLGESFGPINNKIQDALMRIRDNDDL